MKTGNALKQVVYGYWAKRFNCPPEDFLYASTLFVNEEELDGVGKIYIYHIDQMSVIRNAPPLAQEIELSDGYEGDSVSLTVARLRSLIGATYRVELKNTLLDCYLDPKDFNSFVAADNLTERRLYPENDNSYLLGLYAACTAEDLDEAEIYVDVPEYRSRGLGKAVVSALCTWCIENGVAPMYRVFSEHTHSYRIAQALDFKELVIIETLDLALRKDPN